MADVPFPRKRFAPTADASETEASATTSDAQQQKEFYEQGIAKFESAADMAETKSSVATEGAYALAVTLERALANAIQPKEFYEQTIGELKAALASTERQFEKVKKRSIDQRELADRETIATLNTSFTDVEQPAISMEGESAIATAHSPSLVHRRELILRQKLKQTISTFSITRRHAQQTKMHF